MRARTPSSDCSLQSLPQYAGDGGPGPGVGVGKAPGSTFSAYNVGYKEFSSAGSLLEELS